MTQDQIAALIVRNVPRPFWIEARARLTAAFASAPAIIKKHTALKPFRAARVSGQLRFALIEQGFETVGANLGAINLYQQELPGMPDALVFQPLQQFGAVIVGYASQPKPGSLPAKNLTRGRAVQLNFAFSDHLGLDGVAPPAPTLFVSMLTTPDPANPGSVGSIEIGVIDSRYDHFMFHEPLSEFMKRYARPAAKKPPSLVKLRKKPRGSGSAGGAEGTGS